MKTVPAQGAENRMDIKEKTIKGKRELTCIRCPLGCSITVDMAEGKILEITGNTCIRGADYAKKELTDPRRTVTTLVRVKGGEQAVVPVKTASDIPKGMIMDCIRALKEIELTAPVSIGNPVVKDICGTGADVVAAGDVGARRDDTMI